MMGIHYLQALLKRVLLAYARWNKEVGYCQGLNVLAALLLEVMNRSEVESLKVRKQFNAFIIPLQYGLSRNAIDFLVIRVLAFESKKSANWEDRVYRYIHLR